MTTAEATVLFSREQIEACVRELGAEVGRVCAGQELCVVGLMKSCLVFMADLIRAIPLPQTCYFLQSASLREKGGAAASADIVYSTDIPYARRHILLLDDIIDTGVTLSFLLDHIKDHGPASVRVCTLIDEPGERKTDVRPDWAAFTIDKPCDRFIVGYGLDYQQRFRELPYLATIPLLTTAGAQGGRAALPSDTPQANREES